MVLIGKACRGWGRKGVNEVVDEGRGKQNGDEGMINQEWGSTTMGQNAGPVSCYISHCCGRQDSGE